MSYGGDDESEGVGFATAHGRDWPSVRQFNVFLANRLGALMNLRQPLRDDRATAGIIALLSSTRPIAAIIRIVLSDPERALEIFQHAQLPFTESDLLAVTLPDGQQPLVQHGGAAEGPRSASITPIRERRAGGKAAARAARRGHRNRRAASAAERLHAAVGKGLSTRVIAGLEAE